MEKKQQNTKVQIMKIAGKLFSQRGYYGVSMSDIAQELNLTKSSLYYHFASKDKLVEELVENAVKDLKKELKTSVQKSHLLSDVIFNVVKTLLDFKISHPEISLLVSLGATTDNKIPILGLLTQLRTDLLMFIRELIEGADLVRKFTYRSLLSFTTTILGFVLSPFHGGDRSPDQLADDFTQLLFTDPDEMAKQTVKK